MKRRAVLALLAVLGACETAEAPPLTVSEVQVYAPLPGQSMSVAYFVLHAGPAAVTLREVSSPDFADVEMHATIIDDGVAEMLPLDAVTVAEHSAVAFAAGGNHLMLREPRELVEAGGVVTLEFHYQAAGRETGGLLEITAPLAARGVH